MEAILDAVPELSFRENIRSPKKMKNIPNKIRMTVITRNHVANTWFFIRLPHGLIANCSVRLSGFANLHQRPDQDDKGKELKQRPIRVPFRERVEFPRQQRLIIRRASQAQYVRRCLCSTCKVRHGPHTRTEKWQHNGPRCVHGVSSKRCSDDQQKRQNRNRWIHHDAIAHVVAARKLGVRDDPDPLARRQFYHCYVETHARDYSVDDDGDSDKPEENVQTSFPDCLGVWPSLYDCMYTCDL